MTPILYSFRRCPYAMRARLALSAAQIEVEHREVVLRDKPAAMLAASPKGTVPVLVLENRVIDESFDIMLWALEQNDPQGWLLPDRAEMLPLIAHIDGPFKHHLDRYKYASRYDDKAARGDMNTEHREAACKTIALLEDRVSAAPYLFGDAPSLADIASFPFIRQFANADKEFWESSPYPKTQEWLKMWVNSPLFLGVMTKHKPWQATAP